jgi:hypothetical protein
VPSQLDVREIKIREGGFSRDTRLQSIRRRGKKLPQKQMMVPTCPLCKAAMCFPQLDVVGTYEPEASDQSGQVVEVMDLTSTDEDDDDDFIPMDHSGAAQPMVVPPVADEVVELLDAMSIQDENVPIDNPPTTNYQPLLQSVSLSSPTYVPMVYL